MKKRNKLMVAASILMALTMISTSTFSGVLAKYIVSDGATDTARVAKFGVVVTAEGDLFGDTYGGASSSGGGNSKQTYTNKTQAYVSAGGKTTLVVAPGTKNDEGMTFSITGTPEVSTKVTVDAPEGNGTNGTDNTDFANSDIMLKAGNYSIMVPLTAANVALTGDNCGNYYNYTEGTAGRSGSFAPLASAATAHDTIYKKVEMTTTDDGANKMSAPYYPIKWKVNGGSDITNVADVLTAVQTALGGASSANLPAYEYNKSARVTWTWDFSDAGIWADGAAADATLEGWENTSLIDLEDTILGQMMAAADGATNFKLASGDVEILYKQVPPTGETTASNVWVAYADKDQNAPTDATGDSVVACLTARFGARVTVEQVDY